jgi:hypothetical protein
MKVQVKIQASLDMIEGFFILETEGGQDEGIETMDGRAGRAMDDSKRDIGRGGFGALDVSNGHGGGDSGQHNLLDFSQVKE